VAITKQWLIAAPLTSEIFGSELGSNRTYSQARILSGRPYLETYRTLSKMLDVTYRQSEIVQGSGIGAPVCSAFLSMPRLTAASGSSKRPRTLSIAFVGQLPRGKEGTL